MTFEQIYSSSTANLYIATANSGQRLMIECGLAPAGLQKALNYDLSGIVGCLVSHEHADHSRGIQWVMKAGIYVYASRGTLDALGASYRRRAIGMLKNTPYYIGSFEVYAYESNHDAAEPLLFVVRCDGETLLFATDTSHIIQKFKTPFNIIAIECSYDKDILQHSVDTQDIHEEVAKRLLFSHMEKQEAIRYLTEFCDLSHCRELHLLHMSADNLDKAQTKIEFEKKLFIETRYCNENNCRSGN